MASEQNPYRAPASKGDYYVDPRLHAAIETWFELTEDDVRAGIKRYVREYPLLAFGGICAIFAPISLLMYLEEVHGFMPNLPFWSGGLMVMAGAYSAWYLMSLPLRIFTERNIRANKALAPGAKVIRLKENRIEVVVANERFEFPLKDALIRGNAKEYQIVIEVARHQILIIPWHAFPSGGFVEFGKALKKRVRRHSRLFWTTR